MPARYHLRFQLHPGPDAAAQAAELAKFCGEASVDEVVLLLGAEELYAGHPAGPAEDLLVETAATALGVLREAGLEVSLNPWVTAGHADRGRADTLGFTPMVAPDGTVASAQVSFACPRWRAWITAHYARFAALGFRVLWLEDDFRYHNHAPLPWGGGFEQPMLDRLARLVGEPVTREQVVAAVTAPGAPHPWRALLQQVWRTAQLEVAADLADAVATHSGGASQLGLMSSTLGVASVEGRDWSKLFQALSVGGRVAHRPHFAAYSDTPGRELSSSVWMLEQQRALRPSWATSEPEIENWPHTAWSKSDTQTWSELVTAALAGSDALFLNLHPMHSGRAQRYPRIAELLRRSRPALDLVTDERADGFETLGVGLPFRQDVAAHVRTRTGGDLAELSVDPGRTADFLMRYGVPVAAGVGRVNALFGTLAWAFTDAEVERLLCGGLLVDGTAAAILTERGFGPLLGLEAAELVGREQHPAEPGPYAVERHQGEEGEIWLSVNTQPALARLSPLPEATVTTRITTPDGRFWGPGRCHFRNQRGGRVVVLAATAPEQLPFDDDGQRLLHTAVRFLEGDRPALPLVDGGPHLVPHLVRTPAGHRLAVANGSADAARVRVTFPDPAPAATATLLAPLAPPAAAGAGRHGSALVTDAELPHRGWLLLHWS
ncbi:hypothetical protein [Streptacidiphilus jiangxiensis]|uniref:Uncharacterized protein n=1 Tax=Streptacidiphilus jiangxiensis TaxID=235985 RepID=A0A1H7V7S8_STRJI|nr:hypothetical protein [Streptacidiphilus jiangxiensis]SEM05293.1 hypothetical protein SAMN05414137_117148 [Streptacidiphilus jiangxiensis]